MDVKLTNVSVNDSRSQVLLVKSWEGPSCVDKFSASRREVKIQQTLGGLFGSVSL